MSVAIKVLVVGVALAMLLLGEQLVPFYRQFPARGRRHLRHDAVNLAFGVVNAAAVALLLTAAYLAVDAWAARAGFGLLRSAPLPGWAGLVVAIVILDAWMYVWHRLLHRVPVLWRFHRMHHSDPAMDASTGVRFHVGEALLGAILRLGVLLLAGISLPQLAVYEALSLPCILFHHSNVRIPAELDTLGRLAIVTPKVHRIHHNVRPADTHSNFGTILTLWDRVAGTLRLQTEEEAIHFGLPDMRDDFWQTVSGMFATPFTRRA